MNNDLISREALKKEFEKVYPLSTNEMGVVVNKRIYDIIDNAPTVSNKGCISCVHCKVIRTRYFCGNTRLTEKQVFNSKGYCSNFKNKNDKGGAE